MFDATRSARPLDPSIDLMPCAPNPKTKVEQAFLSPSDINAFHTRFVTLRGLAVERGTVWQALRHALAEHGIVPFSPDGEDYGAIYERADLAPLDPDGH